MGNYHWFADKIEEVNWKAACSYEREFIEKLYARVLYSYREFIHRYPWLNFLIPISGGLDSSTVAWCMIEMAKQAIKDGHVDGLNIVMINFISEENDYATRFYKTTAEKYPTVPIQFLSLDIRTQLKQLEEETDRLLQRTRVNWSPYTFLPARIRDSILLELEGRLGYCLIDSFNMTEYILGEFNTGTGTHHFPFLDFYKSMLYELGRLVGLPEWIILRRPINSATGRDKLEDYFGEIPSYFKPEDVFKVLDPVLYRIYVKKIPSLEVAQELGHSEAFTKRVENWVFWQKYKQILSLNNTSSEQLEHQLLNIPLL